MFNTLFRTKQSPTAARVEQVDPPELNKRLTAGTSMVLIDVRTPGEYEYDGHIAGARLLPLSMLPYRLEELPKDSPIVCVCRSGARSQTAAEHLVTQGFTNVINLRGGMISWKSLGLPYQ